MDTLRDSPGRGPFFLPRQVLRLTTEAIRPSGYSSAKPISVYSRIARRPAGPLPSYPDPCNLRLPGKPARGMAIVFSTLCGVLLHLLFHVRRLMNYVYCTESFFTTDLHVLHLLSAR